MVSINAIRNRKSGFPAREWMLDSGAFTEIRQYGRYRDPPEIYAAQIRLWWGNGLLIAAVSQDYMCEPAMLAKTGLTPADHQRLTIERYDAIKAAVGPMVYILPVLQGYWPEEYVSHIRQYGNRLAENQWVGVGSVCKRNARVEDIEHVLVAIQRERPDLRLHGFGVKTTALESQIVRAAFWSADSMAWSYAARREGRDRNSHVEAAAFAERIGTQRVKAREYQGRLLFELQPDGR
jgi:hypothetical protein